MSSTTEITAQHKMTSRAPNDKTKLWTSFYLLHYENEISDKLKNLMNRIKFGIYQLPLGERIDDKVDEPIDFKSIGVQVYRTILCNRNRLKNAICYVCGEDLNCFRAVICGPSIVWQCLQLSFSDHLKVRIFCINCFHTNVSTSIQENELEVLRKKH